jgi:hypothetical protein
MEYPKLSILAVVAFCAFGLLGVAVAGAEGPAILCLVAGCGGLEVKLLGGSFKLEDESQSFVQGGEVASAVTGCNLVAGSGEKDIALCNDIRLVLKSFNGCKNNGNPNGTAEVLLDLDLAAELNGAKELEPLLLLKMLDMTLKPEVTILCSFFVIVLKGTLGCLLLPGLRNIATTDEVEIGCQIKGRGKPLTGECEVACEWLSVDPFVVKLAKATFSPAWMNLRLKGKPSKDIFIDD